MGLRVGFACLWDAEPEGTWSRTPWHLRAAMQAHADLVDLVDLPIAPSALTRTALRALHLRIRRGRPVSLYEQSALTDAYCHRVLTRALTRHPCDIVLQIHDLAVVDQPYLVYQDMSFDALRVAHEQSGLPWQPWLTPTEVARRRDRQLGVYARAAGVVAMSGWLAESLVRDTGLPPERVHVVHPGRTAPVTGVADRPAPRRRLLTVGRGDMRVKGIDLVVAALAVLRAEVDPTITLTIAGPDRWQLDGPVPDGVDFQGYVTPEAVGRLMDTHDLFVLPSRLEAFGIVFVEALARGLPCIGRDALAMPEIIQAGRGGALFSGEDPVDLAHLIAGCLADERLYAACREQAAGVAARFTWERAGAGMAAVAGRAGRAAPVGQPG